MAESAKLDPDCECPVCWNRYNSTLRTPKLLSCRHSFCMECLARLSLATQHYNRLQCPLCRQTTALRHDQPVTDLPTNTTILSQLKLEPEKDGLCARDALRVNYFRRPPSVYTLNAGRDAGSAHEPHQTELQSHLPTIPSEDSSRCCLQDPQLRMFTYLMITMLLVSLMLIFSIFWTRKMLWGPA